MSLRTYAYAAYLAVATLACSSEPSASEQPQHLKIAAVEPRPISAPQAEVQPTSSGLESRLNTFSLQQKKDRQAAIASLTFTNTGAVPLTEDTGVLSICYAPANNLADPKYCIAGGDLHVPPIQVGQSTTVHAQVGIYLGKFSCGGEGGRVPTVHLSLPDSGYNTAHLITPCP